MIKIQKEAPSVVKINNDAVQKYVQYFHYLLSHNTFELTLLNGQVYYTFSDLSFMEWQERLLQSNGLLQATQYLDQIEIEQLSVHSIKSVKDVTTIVKEQYRKQRDIIFESYQLVKSIMHHSEKKIVRDAIRVVEKSRQNTESKRRYWRVLNNDYYGLDIHPLMEYEVDELQRILYACEHYDENPNYAILPWVLASTAILAGGSLVSFVVLKAV